MFKSHSLEFQDPPKKASKQSAASVTVISAAGGAFFMVEPLPVGPVQRRGRSPGPAVEPWTRRDVVASAHDGFGASGVPVGPCWPQPWWFPNGTGSTVAPWSWPDGVAPWSRGGFAVWAWEPARGGFAVPEPARGGSDLPVEPARGSFDLPVEPARGGFDAQVPTVEPRPDVAASTVCTKLEDRKRRIDWANGGSVALNLSTKTGTDWHCIVRTRNLAEARIHTIIRPLSVRDLLFVAMRLLSCAEIEKTWLPIGPHWCAQPETFTRAHVWINYRVSRFLIGPLPPYRLPQTWPIPPADCDDLFALRATCSIVYAVNWGDPELYRYLAACESYSGYRYDLQRAGPWVRREPDGHAAQCPYCVQLRHGRHVYQWARKALRSLPRADVLPAAMRTFPQNSEDVHYNLLLYPYQ